MKYKAVERDDVAPSIALELLENPFDGIILTIGKVSFSEEGDECRMHYDYDIIENNDKEYTKEALEKEIGDIIIEGIINGIEQNSLTYTGGTDGEDREDNFIESDSQ